MIFSICLAILGLIFIYLEFFLPGWILGIGGGLLLIFSIGLFLANTTGLIPISIFLVILFILVVYTCNLALKKIKMSGAKNSFYLKKDQEGFFASSIDRTLIGKTALAATDLKPSGHILVDGVQFQAVSKSGYITKNTKVKIIDGQGGYFIVQTEENL